MSKNRVKTLSVSEAEMALKNGDSVLYVVNSTEPSCMIMVPMRADGAEAPPLIIPVTWAPFDLTTTAPKGQVLASPGFRGFVARGFVTIIDTASAEALFRNDKDAKNESLRANGTIHKAQSGIQSAGENGELVIKRKNSTRTQSEVTGANTRVMSLVAQVDSQTLDAVNAQRLMDNMPLTPLDKDFILANSQSAEMREWAAALDV